MLPTDRAVRRGAALIKLTSKQQAVLEYLQQYVAEHRQAPLVREVQAGCQIASYKSTIDRLNALERKGLIRRRPSQHRGISLMRKRIEQQRIEALGQAPSQQAPERLEDVSQLQPG